MYQFFYSDSTTKEKDSICVLIIFFTSPLRLAGNFLSLFSFFSYFIIIRFGIKYQKYLMKKTSSVGNQEKPDVAAKISRIELRY